MSGGYAPGTLRIWDGSAWAFAPTEWTEGAYEFILGPKADGSGGGGSQLLATTTSCSRTPATIHKGAKVTVTASTTGRNGGNLEFYTRTTSGSWVKIATKAAPTAGGSVSITHAPGASSYYYAKFTGSTTHKASQSAATALTTVQTLKTTTKTVNKGWHQAYNGGGGRISGSGNDGAVHQGYYSGTHGNRKTLLRFDPNLPAGANVTKVVFDCNGAWSHWYNNSGGTIVLGWFHDQNTEPSSWPGGKVEVNKGRKAVNTGGWTVDISSWASAAVERSDWSGITIGPGPSTSKEYYGYSRASPDANDFQLIVTYQYWS